MKKNIVSFMAAVLIMAASAFAQQKPRYTSPVWKAELIKNLQGYVDPSLAVKAKGIIDDYYTLDATKKLAWNKKNTLVDSMEVASAQLGRLNGTKMIPVDTNSTLKIRFLKLEKLFGSEYDSLLFPAYVFQGLKDMDEYNHDLVYSYDLNGDGTNDARSAREGRKDNVIQSLATPVIAGHEGASAEETTASNNKKTSQPAPESTDFSEEEEVDIELPSEPEASASQTGEGEIPVGATGTVVIMEDGTPGLLVNGVVRRLPSAGAQTTEAPKTKTQVADSTTQRARRVYIQEVEQQGNQDLLPQANGNGSKGAAASNSVDSLPDGFTRLPNGVIIQKEKVNGVETRTAWFPDGSYEHLDNNADLAKLSLNGTDIAMSGGKAEAGGKRNAYKYGMRGAAGHTGDYYRRGAGNNFQIMQGGNCVGYYGQGNFIGQSAVIGNFGRCVWNGNVWTSYSTGHMSNSLIGSGNMAVPQWGGVGFPPGTARQH